MVAKAMLTFKNASSKEGSGANDAGFASGLFGGASQPEFWRFGVGRMVNGVVGGMPSSRSSYRDILDGISEECMLLLGFGIEVEECKSKDRLRLMLGRSYRELDSGC